METPNEQPNQERKKDWDSFDAGEDVNTEGDENIKNVVHAPQATEEGARQEAYKLVPELRLGGDALDLDVKPKDDVTNEHEANNTV